MFETRTEIRRQAREKAIAKAEMRGRKEGREEGEKDDLVVKKAKRIERIRLNMQKQGLQLSPEQEAAIFGNRNGHQH